MLLFRKKYTLEESGLFPVLTDWHCHILPGVDDGVQTMDETLKILAEYERLGIGEVWFTPHIMEDIPNTTEHLRTRFTELQSVYDGNVILHLASENMLDKLFEERLKKNDLLPIGEKNDYLLVETSYYSPPIMLYEILNGIKSKGYYPILAHPERYLYMSDADYIKLKSMSVKFQLNMFSLLGAYGNIARKKAQWLIKHNFYDYVGSDLHSLHDLRYIHQK